MAKRTSTDFLAHILLLLMAANYNLKPSLRKYLKTEHGWLNFSVGVRTENNTVERAIINNSGGGVTLSGGEPTLFMEFASDLLKKLRSLNIHNIIETCGQFNYNSFMELMCPYLDAVFYDIKLFAPREHEKYCRVDNSRILSNFEKLHRLYLEGGIEVLPRIALIPDITDTQKNLKDIALFLKKNGVTRVALLQYNPLWVEKAKKLGAANSYTEMEKMTQWLARSQVKECFAIFDDFEVNAPDRGVPAFRGANHLVSRC